MTSTTTTIARTARRTLGRPANRSTQHHDWPAISAVQAAAVDAGLTAELLEWAPRESGVSLTALTEAYVARYVQAYGGTESAPLPASR